MSRGGFNFEGQYDPDDEDTTTPSDASRSVLERWHLLNLMRVPEMSVHFFRILSIIFEVCPPRNYFLKGRKRLAKDAGVSERTINYFFPWAYKAGVLDREKGRRGFSDRKWPDYRMCLRYTTQSVAEMDEDRRAKETDRLAAFGRSLGCNERWESNFRASIDHEARRRGGKHTTAPRAVPTAPRAVPTASQGDSTTASQGDTPLHGVQSRTGISNKTLKQEERREGENGPVPGQARTGPLSSSLSQDGRKDEKLKSNAREKDTEAIRKYLKAEMGVGKGLKPLEEYLGPRWFPPYYDRRTIRYIYEELNVGSANVKG